MGLKFAGAVILQHRIHFLQISTWVGRRMQKERSDMLHEWLKIRQILGSEVIEMLLQITSFLPLIWLKIAFYGMMYIGILRSNKPHIPEAMKAMRREEHSSLFGYHDQLTVVPCVPKQGKTILVIVILTP